MTALAQPLPPVEQELRKLDHDEMPQTFLYRAASTALDAAASTERMVDVRGRARAVPGAGRDTWSVRLNFSVLRPERSSLATSLR